MVLQMSRPSKITSSDTYYFRKRVPADLVGIVGRREIRISLGTKDPTLAKELFRKKEQEIENEWKALRATPESLSHRQIVALSGILYREYVELLSDEAGEPEIWYHALRVANEAYESGQLEKWYGGLVDDLLKKEGIAADTSSRQRLLEAVHSSYKQAAEQLQRHSEGDYTPDPKANRFPPVEAHKKQQTRTSPTTTLTHLFERWQSDHLADEKAAGTISDYQQILRVLIEYLGHEDAQKVTPKDIGSWVEHLRHTKGLSAKTVSSKYLVVVKRIYNAVIQKGEQIENPAQNIRVHVPKKIKERPSGFTDKEAQTILNATLGIYDLQSSRPLINKDAIRWVPWLCAYTGARCGEITQMRTEDLVEEYDILCLRLTPEAGTVKSREYRLVPIHPHLIEMGFLRFVNSRPQGQLFIRNKTKFETVEDLAKRAAVAVNMVGQWVRNAVGIEDPRISPNHAWRHRFKTIARDADIPPEYMNAMQGHEDGRSASDYGEVTVKALHREILKVPRYNVD